CNGTRPRFRRICSADARVVTTARTASRLPAHSLSDHGARSLLRVGVLDVGRHRERGAKKFHLGGGVGGTEDGVFHVKAGFSRDRNPFLHLARMLRSKGIRSNGSKVANAKRRCDGTWRLFPERRVVRR